jgi:hypothetical protein
MVGSESRYYVRVERHIYPPCFTEASTIKLPLSVSVLYTTDLFIASLIINLLSPLYSWKRTKLALSNNHSLFYCNKNKQYSIFFFQICRAIDDNRWNENKWQCRDELSFIHDNKLLKIIVYIDKHHV